MSTGAWCWNVVLSHDNDNQKRAMHTRSITLPDFELSYFESGLFTPLSLYMEKKMNKMNSFIVLFE